jgi:hypothetical protein
MFLDGRTQRPIMRRMYLSSGREQDAWDALARTWPPADLDRIRTSIVNAQARGLRSQVDGVSHKPPPSRPKHSEIYAQTYTDWLNLGRSDAQDLRSVGRNESIDLRAIYANTRPREILLKIPPPHDPQ